LAQKYLCEYYTYKGKRCGTRVIIDSSSSLEKQIQQHILAGNDLFFQNKHAAALEEYLEAWGLLPKLVYPIFPQIVGQINPNQLLEVEIVQNLTDAGIQILKLRNETHSSVPITSISDPPTSLIDISEKYTGKMNSKSYYDLGVAYARVGQALLAEKYLSKALERATNELALQADIRMMMGAIKLNSGDMRQAQLHLNNANELYQQIKNKRSAAAAQHNLGIALTLAGDMQTATKYLTSASLNLPLDLDWKVTQTFNPGISSVTRPTGKQGFQLLVKDSEGKWVTMSADTEEPRTVANLIYKDTSVKIILDQQAANTVESVLLEPRINANSLLELETYQMYFEQFVTYLAHAGGFILPLALGDTYFALGDYDQASSFYLKVRDYRYLNLSIERPLVWRKLANVYLQQANRLYRDQRPAEAKQKYELIVKVNNGSFDLSGPLYSGKFEPLKADTLDFLNSQDRIAFAAMDYARRLIILEALTNLNQILNNINYLGFPNDIIPIHSWRYLQNVARYFANQAIQAERSYIDFKNRSEQEEYTRLLLEQDVDAQRAAFDIELMRVNVAEEQARASRLASELSNLRLSNAREQKTEYDNVSRQTAYIDEIIAFTNSADRDIEISEQWAGLLGIERPRITLFGQEITLDTFSGMHLVQLLTRKRSQLTRDYELHNMQRKIEELDVEAQVAQSQYSVAQRMYDVAVAQSMLAHLRMNQAEARLEFFNSREFTPELWNNLAEAVRATSRRYLDWAISTAFLMERAFELEYDIDVHRIRFDYQRSELRGLLSGDFLLADIDQFSYDRIIDTEKKSPLKVVISLADRYPYQFYHQFQRNGRIDFETFLEDFDRLHPGTFLRKLKRVEIIVEGLVGPQGLYGTLTNSGISVDRDRRGNRKMRPQTPEVMILSRYDIRSDGFVFALEEEKILTVFENSGLATGWILEFPAKSNDIDYAAITNVHMVFYFDAYYSKRVANVVRAELAATLQNEYSLGVGLRFQYPDEFFAFQTSGEVSFTIDRSALPFDKISPIVKDLHILIETKDGVSAASLTVGVSSGGVRVDQTTDGNGMIATDGSVALNAFRNRPLIGTWTIRIDKNTNTAAFSAGFQWKKVRNIYVFVDYIYTPRGHITIEENFDLDPLQNFEIVDDLRATSNSPSNWVYNSVDKRLEQISSIYGPAGPPPMDTGVDRPGTYLVHKTSAQWPEMSDFILRCLVNSTDDDALGVIFRYKDNDNFYFFLMDSRRRYRRIGKKIGGQFKELDTPAVDTSVGFEINRQYELKVAIVEDIIKVYLDSQEILSGRDTSLNDKGRIGFYSWNNSEASFMSLTQGSA
jgi:hypothetical protein